MPQTAKQGPEPDLSAYGRTTAEIDAAIVSQRVRLERVRQYRYARAIAREESLLDVLLEERQAAVA